MQPLEVVEGNVIIVLIFNSYSGYVVCVIFKTDCSADDFHVSISAHMSVLSSTIDGTVDGRTCFACFAYLYACLIDVTRIEQRTVIIAR